MKIFTKRLLNYSRINLHRTYFFKDFRSQPKDEARKGKTYNSFKLNQNNDYIIWERVLLLFTTKQQNVFQKTCTSPSPLPRAYHKFLPTKSKLRFSSQKRLGNCGLHIELVKTRPSIASRAMCFQTMY